MLDKIKDFLHIDTTAENVIFVIACIVLVVIAIVALIWIFEICSKTEEETGEESHPIIKAIIIALVPTVYTVVALLSDLISFDDFMPQKFKWPLFAVACVIVLIWNLIVFKIKGGILFTILHVVYGAIITVIVAILVEIAVIAIVLGVLWLFFGGVPGGGGEGSSETSVPSYLTDTQTNEQFYTTKGVNGEPCVHRHGQDILIRPSDYAGRYIDSYGNTYVK